MATAKSQSQSDRGPMRTKPPSLKRKIIIASAALILILIVIILFNFGSIKNTSRVGVAYASHIVCSCRFIQGRDMNSCKTDLEDGMGAISLSDDPENLRVTASVPLMASAIAEKRDDFGCIILNDEERTALE